MRQRWRARAFVAFSLVALPLSFLPAADNLKIVGEASTEARVEFSEQGEPEYLGHSRLRLTMRSLLNDDARVEASGFVRLDWSDASVWPPQPYFELSRLFVSLYTERADILIGRQIANYGRGNAFSPVDIFSKIDRVDLSRTGTELLRIKLPIGALSGVDVLASLSRPLEEFSGGVRGFTSIAGWNLAVGAFQDGGLMAEELVAAGLDAGPAVLAAKDSSLAASFDLKGNLLLGISGEALFRVPWESDFSGLRGDDWTVELMAGLDYSFFRKLFLDAEYLWKSVDNSHHLFGSISWKMAEVLSLSVFGGGEWGGLLWGSFALSWQPLRATNLTLIARYNEGILRPWTLGLNLAVSF